MFRGATCLLAAGLIAFGSAGLTGVSRAADGSASAAGWPSATQMAQGQAGSRWVFRELRVVQPESQPVPGVEGQPGAGEGLEFSPEAPLAQGAQPWPGGQLEDGIYVLDQDYLLSWPENVWRIVTGPLRYERDDWRNVTFVAITAGTLILLDEVVRDFWQDDVRGDTSDSFADAFRGFGDLRTVGAGTLGAYALAELFGQKREKAAALLAFESLLLTAVLIDGIKTLTGRQRPNDTDDRFDWKGPEALENNSSFPSGHAGHAFAVASVVAEVYGDTNPWVPYLAYGLATGTAWSRINDNKHWLSDTFVSASIGYLIGKMVTRFNPFLEDQGVAMKPFASQGAQGVKFSVPF